MGRGTCASDSGAAVCSCKAAFSGPHCASCAQGYVGGDCELCDAGCYEFPAGSGTCVDDPCAPDACHAHGSCDNTSGGAACTCATGYAGASCDQCDAGYYEYPAGSGTCVDDPCLPDACNARGSCANASGAAVCQCDVRFTGSACESCAAGYIGGACELCDTGYYEYPATSGLCLDDPCQPGPCNGRGSCTNTTGSAVCACTGNYGGATCATCKAGYTGATCMSCAASYYEFPASSGTCIDDPCQPEACNAQGTCDNTSGAAACTCSAGYTGATCGACASGYYQYPAASGTCVDDPCIPDACNGHGSCANGTGSAVCTCSGHYDGADCTSCDPGYTGATCSNCAGGYIEYPASSGTCIDDPCAPDPCNGNGTCANTTGAAVCTCTGNFTGSRCNSCVTGYTGADCNTNIDDCTPNPCKNAGVCSDGVAAYTCSCKGAWDGPTCETIYYGDAANMNLARLAESNANCREETFLDISDWLPDPNGSYSDPTLTVSCTASVMSVTSNSVPQYKIDWENPSRNSFANTLVPTTTTYNIPRTPTYNATPKQATVVGGVGVAINGVQVSSPSASGGPLQYADPAGTEVDGDLCMGHPNPSGKYHYHALMTSCLFPDADDGELMGDPCTAPSPIIAWIADGYPMLGPCECLDAACTQVVEMRSSYVLDGGDDDPDACAYQDYTYQGNVGEDTDGDKYLDECSGHVGPAGDYHYHITNEYPWTLRCYRGNPTTSGMAIGHQYNAAAGGNDCCFEKQCEAGVFQSGGGACMAMSCTP